MSSRSRRSGGAAPAAPAVSRGGPRPVLGVPHPVSAPPCPDPRSAAPPRRAWRRAALAVLGLTASALLTACDGSPRELTILVVSLDTTRPDHLSPYGYDRLTTPTLARLADEGVVFRNARSTTSWTLPAHVSLFTGLPTALHGVVMDFHVLDPSRPTMGERFKAADFRTMGFYSAPYLHSQYGFDRGMDYYERCIEPTIFDVPPAQRAAQVGLRELMSHGQVSSHDVVRRFIKTFTQRRRPRTFGFLHFFDPHYDYLAPKEYVQRFADPGYAGPVSGKHVMNQGWVLDAALPPADLQHVQDLYDAELAWVDANLAAIVELLEKEGLADSTILVVTGDHGEAFFEHDRFGHRQGLYDEVLRVPLLFWAPGRMPAGLAIDDAVSLCDVLPTLLDYAGIEGDDAIYGRSLRPLIEGRNLPPVPVSGALTLIPAPPQGHYEQHDAIVLEGLKCVRKGLRAWSPDDETDLTGEWIDGSVTFEVYDLLADPGETNDLYGTDDPRVDAIVERLEAERLRQLDAYQRLGAVDEGVATDRGISAHEIMRAVGYLGASDDPPADPRPPAQAGSGGDG